MMKYMLAIYYCQCVYTLFYDVCLPHFLNEFNVVAVVIVVVEFTVLCPKKGSHQTFGSNFVKS